MSAQEYGDACSLQHQHTAGMDMLGFRICNLNTVEGSAEYSRNVTKVKRMPNCNAHPNHTSDPFSTSELL